MISGPHSTAGMEMASAGSQQWGLSKFLSSRFPGQMAGAVPTAWCGQDSTTRVGLPGGGGEDLVPRRGLTPALGFEVASAPWVGYSECLGHEAPCRSPALGCLGQARGCCFSVMASLPSTQAFTEVCVRCHWHGLVAGGPTHHPPSQEFPLDLLLQAACPTFTGSACLQDKL